MLAVAAAIGLGLLIGLSLGALGGGGSILTVPALVHVVGQDARAATTSSLFIVGLSAVIAALGHARSGRVRWRVAAVFGVTGIAAGFAGTAANQRVDPDVLLLAFSAVVALAALGMLARSGAPAPGPEADRSRAGAGAARDEVADRAPGGSAHSANPDGGTARRAATVVGAGLVVGFLTGFFGVGGGFVIVPALTLALGMPMPQAVGTSLVVISINSGGALLARAGTAHFDWAVIVPFTAAAIAGSLGGKQVADRVPGTTLTRAFAGLLLAVAAYTGGSSLLSLTG